MSEKVMINLANPELAEIAKGSSLPPASLSALQALRTEMCETTSKAEFTLQSHQRFLRRVLSPDSPIRNLLMVHGTGVGKTCTAIQIAEEYILRPEFQDKKVMVVASRAVQENFRTQIFDMSRVYVDSVAGTLSSKQCTGRRYLDMLTRIESEPKNWNNPDTRDKLESIADKMIGEFYEFMGYYSFGNQIRDHLEGPLADIDMAWVHENFDNRLLIIDEAHNIRESKNVEVVKGIAKGLENLVKTAKGLVLVFLTATPMFDSYDEIVFYMNLFLWNDRKQEPEDSVSIEDFFNPDATLLPGEKGEKFRKWCQDYVSYVRGENPFTFPFRLPPPVLAPPKATRMGFNRKPIGTDERIKYLDLVESIATGTQLEALGGIVAEGDEEEQQRAAMMPTVAVLPGKKSFSQVFRTTGKQYVYAKEACLTPAELPSYSAKFASVIKSIETGKGLALVYSNFATMGARLFAMALEEHGYLPARGETLFAKPSYTGNTKGRYVLLTSDTRDAELSKLVDLTKRRENSEGTMVRVIISSPLVSEGVDFRYIRQVHVLDPWWNMSRIEQVVGRALRTCSHQLLTFEQQNCAVYLHVIRTGDGRECFDEYTYRTRVEPKAVKIANVRKVISESAMDCPLQNQINSLPSDWKNLEIPQIPSEGTEPLQYKLKSMLSPTFDEEPDVFQCRIVPRDEKEKEDELHVRPLSSYLDVRDEILTRLETMLFDKPIWDREQLYQALNRYNEDAVVYTVQEAIMTGFRFKDAFGRASVLESKGDLYALAPIGVANQTMVERSALPPVRGAVDLPDAAITEEETTAEAISIDERREAHVFPADAAKRFSKEILNAYVFDHDFTDAEKRAFLKANPEHPITKRLTLRPGLFVLGDKTFEPPELPTGVDNTRLKEWTKALMTKFLANRTKLFASLTSSGKFTISKMIVEGDKVRRNTEKQKRYAPIVCGTGDNDKPTMLAFARFIDKKKNMGVPKEIAERGSQWCGYTELLAREETNCFWLTPEELSVLYSEENQKVFTEAFKTGK